MSQAKPVIIDGSQGEGGGQIVRSALTLSCLTGRSLHLVNVRAGRPKPGLARQHVTCIEAARTITNARVRGASRGSLQFWFEPDSVRPGQYHFDVGTAGSTSLVLQTIALPLALAVGDSRVSVTGGTHNPWAPCFEYLQTVWAPLLGRLRLRISLRLVRAGFYPVGGGLIEAEIRGQGSAAALTAVTLTDRGPVQRIDGFSAVARLPASIARRQADQAARRLGEAGIEHESIRLVTMSAPSPGTVLFLACHCSNSVAAFFGLGARGKPAERVADEAAEGLIEYLGRPGALDPHAADQFILPAALAPQPSSLTTTRVSRHLITHVQVLSQFIDRPVRLCGQEGQPGTIEIGPWADPE